MGISDGDRAERQRGGAVFLLIQEKEMVLKGGTKKQKAAAGA